MGRLILFYFIAALGVVNAWAQASRPKVVARPPMAQIMAPRTFVSANGRFRIVVEAEDYGMGGGFPQRVKALATMTEMVSGAASNLWRSKFTSIPLSIVKEADAVVADDGSSFLIESTPAQWTILRKDRDPIVTPLWKAPSDSYFAGRERTFAEMDQLKEAPVLRIWHRDEDAWKAYSMETGDSITVTPELEKQWNETSLKTIRDRIERSYQHGVREKITAVSPKLSALAAGAMPPLKPGELKDVHFEFLTTRRNPADRIYLEELLNHHQGLEPNIFWNIGGQRNAVSFFRMGSALIKKPNLYSFELGDYDRERGDWLLAVFDQKITTKERFRSDQNDRPLFSLGRVYGNITMPAPISRHSGSMRIYLAPADRAGKTWDGSEVDALVAPMETMYGEDYDFPEMISFGFITVRTGAYMAKAIWDKRRGFDDLHSAGPGDYESAWVGPIVVNAGENVEGVRLDCTNRASGGDAYYRADELAGKMVSSRSAFATADLDVDTREIFSAAFSRWVISTNSHTPLAADGLKRIALVANANHAKTNKLQRPPRLIVEWRKSSFPRRGKLSSPATLSILDEHGCEYAASHIDTAAQNGKALFPTFPRGAAAWRLVGYGPSGKSEVLFDYGLTNLIRTDRKQSRPPLTLPFEVPIGSVRMNVTRLSGFGSEGSMDTAFTEDGKPTMGWWVSQMIFADDDGNFIDPADMCREQKSARVLGRITRNSADLPDETREFEFTVDRKAYFSKDR